MTRPALPASVASTGTRTRPTRPRASSTISWPRIPASSCTASNFDGADCGAHMAPENMLGTPCAKSLVGFLRSLGLNAREFDDFRPFLGFVGDELAEVGRRAGNHRTA